MGDAKLIWDQSFQLTENFRVEVKVYEVEPKEKYPEGVKARFVLIDMERNLARLLVDNHAPYGFHIHTGLPEDKTTRVVLNAKDFYEAFEEFINEAERIVKNEK